MRMAKKVAAVALAAVMALSMLTACGGGGSSSGGNNNNGSSNGGNNSSSNVGGDTNGGGANSGSNSGSNSGTSMGGTGAETKPTSTTLKNSRTGALVQKAMSSGQIQLVVVSNEYDEILKDYPQTTLAMSGKNVYTQAASKDGSKKYIEEIGNGTERKAYLVLYPDSPQYKSIKEKLENKGYDTEKLTMPIYIEDEEEYDPNDSEFAIDLSDYEENAKVEIGTYTYKKTKQTYDAEKLTDKDGDQTIYCYDKSNTLRLIVEFDKDSETGVVKELVSEVKSVAFTVNQAIFKVNKDAIEYTEIENYVTKK